MCNIRASQETVVSPFLFTTYTSDFQYSIGSRHLQKFSDDTTIVGCVENGQENEHMILLVQFICWCGKNHLQLKVKKTKEMVVDFRRNKPTSCPGYINGRDIKIVQDNKLD